MNRIIRIAALALALAPATLKAETRLAEATLMPADTLWACYVPGSGSVYRIKTEGAPDACTKSKHVEFSWQAGASLQMREVLVVSSMLSGAGDMKYATAACNADEIVVSGGAGSFGKFEEVIDLISSNKVGNGWYAKARIPTDAPAGQTAVFFVQANCAKVGG